MTSARSASSSNTEKTLVAAASPRCNTALIDDKLFIGGNSDKSAVKNTKKSPAVIAPRWPSLIAKATIPAMASDTTKCISGALAAFAVSCFMIVRRTRLLRSVNARFMASKAA